MILQPIEITQNNYGQEIPFTLLDGSGNPVNLSGVTLTLKVQDSQDANGTLLPLTGSVTVDSAVNGTCHYTIANGDFTYPATFRAELVATFPNGPVSFSGIQIIVLPSLPQTNN